MASLFRFLIFISFVISFAHSSTFPLTQDNLKIIKPFYNIASMCAGQSIFYARHRKLICILCKGLDPSCFSTSSSTTSTSTTSTTPTSTTTTSTTPASTTSTTTATPTTPTTTTSSTTSTTTTEGPTE